MGEVQGAGDETFIQGFGKAAPASYPGGAGIAGSDTSPASANGNGDAGAGATAVNGRQSHIMAPNITPPRGAPHRPRGLSEYTVADRTTELPSRPESLELFRPPSFLEEETETDTLAGRQRRTLRQHRSTEANDVFLADGEKILGPPRPMSIAEDSTETTTTPTLDPRIAALAQDLAEQDAAVDRGLGGHSILSVTAEYMGKRTSMTVGNPNCGVPAFTAGVQQALDLDPLAGIMLHYVDAVGDVVEIVDELPFAALRDALEVARAVGDVLVTVMQIKRAVVDATSRALRRQARGDKLTQTKRPPSVRPPSGSDRSSRSSRPDSIVGFFHEDIFPVTRVAQQLGLDYVDGSRPVNITTSMDIALAAEDGAQAFGDGQTVASLLIGQDIQQGDDPQYADEYAMDKVKGGCAKCHRRFRFAIEHAEPDDTHTAVVACPGCDTVNLFVIV